MVDTGSGSDVGQISLSGDLVRLQMKKKRMKEDRVVNNVIRLASERDLEKMGEARNLEKPAMVKARVIARNLDLNMKVGDVEYQADQRKKEGRLWGRRPISFLMVGARGFEPPTP